MIHNTVYWKPIKVVQYLYFYAIAPNHESIYCDNDYALIHMKFKALVLLSLIVIISVISSPSSLPIVEGKEITDVKVLMLISDNFGWNYFDAKEILESWGANVTTLSNSLDTNVSACVNRPHNWTIADLLLKNVQDDIANQFDVLFIPAGAQWQSLIVSTRVRNFISHAYDLGLIIASVCIGNRVLSEANEIVNGSNVASYPNANSYMFAAGATIRYGNDVVSDNRFITGGAGGGPTGGGYTVAPTSEVCAAVMRAALDYSYVDQASIVPLTGEEGTNFTVTVNVDNLNSEFGELFSVDTNITEVVANIFTKENRTFIESIELNNTNLDSAFVGTFTGTKSGEYLIDFEIEDSNSSLEVERGLVAFSVGEETTLTTTTSTSSGTLEGPDVVLIGTIGGISAVVIVIIAVILKKYR